LRPPPGGALSIAAARFDQAAGAGDAVTLLAALRRRLCAATLPPDRTRHLERFLIHPESLGLLLPLLRDLGVLIPAPLRPDPGRARELLAATRAGVEARLLEAWRRTSVNDLASVPGLAAPKAGWPNDPVTSRNALLTLLAERPSRQWYSLEMVLSLRCANEPGVPAPRRRFRFVVPVGRGNGPLSAGRRRLG
jgi:hypothetical protein